MEHWFEQHPSHPLFLSVLTLGEIRRGVERLAERERQQTLRRWLEQDLPAFFSGRVLPIDGAIAHRWGRLLAEMGRPLAAIDSLLSGDNEVGRSATSSLAGGVSAGDPGADAQGPGDAGTTDEPPTQSVHGKTTRRQQPGGGCRSGGHLSAQCPPD